MDRNGRDFVPALHFRALTGLYDLLTAVFLPEKRLKGRIVSRIAAHPGQSVLDFGCGTGTLLLMLHDRLPGTQAVGLDIDPDVLRIAERKKRERNADVRFDLYDGGRLPYPDGAFDAVVTSLVIHHLTPERKRETFSEFFRVLRPAGRVYLADLGVPSNAAMRLLAALLERLEPVSDNTSGRLPACLAAAGFRDTAVTARFDTVIGTIELYEGRRPCPEPPSP